MAGSKSDVYEIDLLKAATGQTTTILTTTPITPYVALFTVAPTDSTSGTEVSGGAYARVSGASKFAVPSAGSCSNNAVITFPTATANWGTVVAFAVMSASTAGSILYWGDLTTSRAIVSGDTPSFAASSLTLTED
jgi:hypothetical protein